MKFGWKKIIAGVIIIVVVLAAAGWGFLYIKTSDPVLVEGEVLPSRLGVGSSDYEREKMNPEVVEPWEDGLRTTMEPGTYEWWYFDGHMDDGTKIVVVYLTKKYVTPQTDPEPHVTINMILPDGERISVQSRNHTPGKDASFKKGECDVQIGDNYCKGDLTRYQIYANVKGIEVDLELERSVPPWRPGNGHLYFGEEGEKYFAWLAAVPDGDIRGTITREGTTRSVKGTGYHDHNWGNTPVSSLLKEWWWGRAKAGDYTIIAVDMLTRNLYGDKKYQVFMISNREGILADDSRPAAMIEFTKENVRPHPDSARKGSIAGKLAYTYSHDNTRARVVFSPEELIDSTSLLDKAEIKGFKRLLVRSFGKNPWYTRFSSHVELELNTPGVKETVSGISVLEKMELD